MLLRRRPSTSIGRGPLLRKRCAYNPIPEPKFKTRVMTTTEMAITRLAATAVSQRSRFSGSIRSSKLHHSFAAPHLELTYVTQRGNNPGTHFIGTCKKIGKSKNLLSRRLLRGSRSSGTGLPMEPVIGDIGGHAAPHKTAPTPPCLRARSSTLCQCRRAGWLVADDVCPGHCMA